MHPYAPVDLNPDDLDAQGDVIVVNYNGRNQLEQTLPVWIDHREAGYVDTIRVVDNDSEDGSRTLVRDEFPGVELVANDENVGWGVAVNRGVECSTAPYAFITTPDMVVTRSWCHRLIEALDAKPGRGAATSVIVRPSGEVDGRGANANALFHFLPATPSDDVTKVDSARGSGLAVDCEAVRKAGGIDEDLFIQWGEISLTLNLDAAGYDTVFVPGGLAWHCEKLGGAMGLEYYRDRNLFLLAARHLSVPEYAFVAAANVGYNLVGYSLTYLLRRRSRGALLRSWRGTADGFVQSLREIRR